MSGLPHSFFAYPSQPPSVPEVIQHATSEFNKGGLCPIKTWEECRLGGKIIINAICKEIDSAGVVYADLTGSNPNVMFELGYSIARNKRVLLFLDTTRTDSTRTFEQLRILTTVGYVPYCNSADMVRQLYSERPWEDLDSTVFSDVIEPALTPPDRRSLLYLKNLHNTEAAVKLSTAVAATKMPVTISDPRESAVQTLGWYSKKVASAVGVVVHLCGPDREGSTLHNSRYAFVAGLAHGLDVPLLMLADETYNSPIDYRDMLQQYRTGSDCVEAAEEWLDAIYEQYCRSRRTGAAHQQSLSLAADLRTLRIGEYIAENEETDLPDYFLETASFRAALEGRHTLVVGRKGSGKTANLYAIADELRQDKRNLVCVVKPASYEFESVLRLLRKYQEQDEKGYLIESLWKFLIYTEIARATVQTIKARRRHIEPDSPEDKLVALMEHGENELGQDFAVRLERAVTSLFEVNSESGVEAFRVAIAEALHAGILQNLRSLLGQVLTTRERVAVLVDNLDKAWDKRTDLKLLTDFLLGLLRVSRDIRQEFGREDQWRQPVALTLTIFVRADIFSELMKAAREPDKISYSRLVWEDPETLVRIVDERLASGDGDARDPNQVWQEMFCPRVNGSNARQYFVDRCLPRPRDIVFFVSAAIATAVNRGHSRVEERDIIDGEREYSQFVFESILVENGVSVPELELILYEFAGQPAVLTESDVIDILTRAGLAKDRQEYAMRHLCGLSFLGVETKPGQFVFTSDEDALKTEVIARKMAAARGTEVRYKVNPPFHAFLEISEN
ncbi:MAG: hypothetical protein KAS72_01410 [Phycisphaerales bacterium]|nr:hypothetical protein [Phycisphaerales bacterium]